MFFPRSKSSRCGLHLNPFSDGGNFGGKSLRGLLSCVSSNKVKTKLQTAMDFSTPLFCCLTQTEEWKQNLFCWNILTFFAGRDGVGLMCRGRGMNTMHLTPTAWIQYMRARGEIHCWNLYCLGWWGQQLAKVHGCWCRFGIHVFGGVKLAPMWPAQYWDCSWLPHVGCSVSFVIVFRLR